MNALALVAILFATPLVQSDATEATGCKAALNELAIAARTAVLATDAADALGVKVDDLQSKLDACHKEKGKNGSGCAKLQEKLKAAELELDSAEDQLSVALEGVDAAYDEFDVSCSWDDPDTNVQVRDVRPAGDAARPAEGAARGR
jgi:septal ring factor EnvC (AmiA/AmiB activator)